ncbi:versican core protein-like [Patiria miniata]|uniref:Uncharacterized protein n=1 Tax=Patiria miniata TaxID=46514 RepID=A0A914A6I0_PATMI|nr:versican core protein-like [Patiria miniata]
MAVLQFNPNHYFMLSIELLFPHPCNTGWHHFQGSCYLFWTKTLTDRTFDGHQKNCINKGGNLASIHNHAENQFIYGKIRAIGGWFWLGFEDHNGDKVLQWTDRSPADYLNFGSSNLPSGRRLCSNMQSNSDKWSVSQHCTSNAQSSVCKKPANQLPCEAAICLNGGICVPSGSSYTCKCEKGYTGKYCQKDVDECNTANCNSSHCIDGLGSAKCLPQ